MENAVTYIRRSTDKQEESIEQQIAAAQALAGTCDYRIIKQYTDDAISGVYADNRPALQELLRDAQAGTFKVIITWDQDRFSRGDPFETIELIAPLRRKGIVLHTVTEGILSWNDLAGQLVFMVKQHAKNDYVRSLSKNSSRGLIENAKRGRSNGGPTPYGLLPDGKHQPDKAPIVLEIFTRYATTSDGIRALATDLNLRRVPPPQRTHQRKAPLWYAATISRILRNPAYLGKRLWNRTSYAKFYRPTPEGISPKGERGRQPNPPDQWFESDAYEPLISPALWHAVQARLERRRRTAHQPRLTSLPGGSSARTVAPT